MFSNPYIAVDVETLDTWTEIIYPILEALEPRLDEERAKKLIQSFLTHHRLNKDNAEVLGKLLSRTKVGGMDV